MLFMINIHTDYPVAARRIRICRVVAIVVQFAGLAVVTPDTVPFACQPQVSVWVFNHVVDKDMAQRFQCPERITFRVILTESGERSQINAAIFRLIDGVDMIVRN